MPEWGLGRSQARQAAACTHVHCTHRSRSAHPRMHTHMIELPRAARSQQLQHVSHAQAYIGQLWFSNLYTHADQLRAYAEQQLMAA